MRRVSKRQLVGRRIVDFDPQPFYAGKARDFMAHDPVITLDDGSKLTFTVEETDAGEYGIAITKWPAK